MNEIKLNAMMGIVSDPIKNVYSIKTFSEVQEVQRMVRIFNISQQQENKHRMFSIKNMATMKLVLSNN